MVPKLQWFCWMGGFCLLVKVHRERSAEKMDCPLYFRIQPGRDWGFIFMLECKFFHQMPCIYLINNRGGREISCFDFWLLTQLQTSPTFEILLWHFEIILDKFKNIFGILLRFLSDTFWMLLGYFLNTFRILFGYFWDTVGTLFKYFWDTLWILFGYF